jgi:ADP-heptose:LPS heptosyltransferase
MGMLTSMVLAFSRGASARGTVDFTRVLKHPKKVLCLPAQEDGELLLALPAIRSLRRHCREAMLALLVSEHKRGLWRLDDEVDEVIEFRPELLKGVSSSEFKRLSGILGHRHFDLAIDLSYRPRALWSYLIHQARPAVFAGAQSVQTDKYRNLVVRNVSLPADEVQRNLAMLRVLGISYEGHAAIWPRLADSEGKREFRERLRADGLRRHQNILAVDAAPFDQRQLAEFLDTACQNQAMSVMLFDGTPLPETKREGSVIRLESPSAAEAAEALACAHGFIGVKNDLFSMAYLLRVPSVITVPDGTQGLPAAGPLLALVPHKGRPSFPRPASLKLMDDISHRPHP